MNPVHDPTVVTVALTVTNFVLPREFITIEDDAVVGDPLVHVGVGVIVGKFIAPVPPNTFPPTEEFASILNT
jgi:hypothetical protein